MYWEFVVHWAWLADTLVVGGPWPLLVGKFRSFRPPWYTMMVWYKEAASVGERAVPSSTDECRRWVVLAVA